MMISGGRFGIAASNSSFIHCGLLSQQTYIPPLLRNVFAITICFSAGSFYSWSLLSFAPVSLPAGMCTPRRAELGTICAAPDKPHVKRREEKHVLSHELLQTCIPSLGLLQAPAQQSVCPLKQPVLYYHRL